MSPSLDGTLPESVISHENNSPLTLYIEFQMLIWPLSFLCDENVLGADVNERGDY